MAIIRWTPFHDVLRMRDAMDDFFEEGYMPRWPEVKEFAPAIDVSQDKENVYVETELPGIEPDKVDISVEDDTLMIKGETKMKKEEKDKNYVRREIRCGSFLRSVALPSSVESDKAEAEYKDGILKVRLPKVEKPAAKKIAVKVETKNE